MSRKEKLKSSLLIGLVSLLLFFPNFRSGELTDIAKPYLGVYTCQQATLGVEEVLQRFVYITIELKDDGVCLLRYKEKDGNAHTVQGKYHYDGKGEILTLSTADGNFIKREFPLKNGKIYITVPFLGKTLQMQFEQN